MVTPDTIEIQPLHKQVYEFLTKNPQTTIEDLRRNFDQANPKYLSKLKSYFLNGKDHRGKRLTTGKKKSKKPTTLGSSKKTSRKPTAITITSAGDPGTFDPDILLKELCVQGNPTALNIFFNRFYDKHKAEEQNERDYYSRPDWLYPHQFEQIRRMRDGNFFLVGMRQLTGKTTGTLVAALEELRENPGSRINIITTSKDLSKDMLSKIRSDAKLWGLWEKEIFSDLKESVTLTNRSMISLLPCKISAVQGQTANVVWFEEIDKTISEKGGREVLAAALPQVLKTMLEGKGKVWITCNQGTNRAFHFFVNVLKKFGGSLFPIGRIIEPVTENDRRFIVIENESVPSPVITDSNREAFMKNIMYELLLALADEQFAKAMILNIEDFSKDMFNPELLSKCWESWSEASIPEYPTNVVMGVDPGHTHATGVIVLSMDNQGHVWEAFADQYFGGQISENDLKQKVYDLYIQYGCRRGLCESQWGALFWLDEWRSRGLNFWSANFGTGNPNTGETSNATKAIERGYKERVLKDLLEKGKIHLHSKELWNQFSVYNPTENKEAGKGDLVDALLHAAFDIVGGVDYYINEIMKEGGEEDSAAYVG